MILSWTIGFRQSADLRLRAVTAEHIRLAHDLRIGFR
jgi:hypothetical protein